MSRREFKLINLFDPYLLKAIAIFIGFIEKLYSPESNPFYIAAFEDALKGKLNSPLFFELGRHISGIKERNITWWDSLCEKLPNDEGNSSPIEVIKGNKEILNGFCMFINMLWATFDSDSKKDVYKLLSDMLIIEIQQYGKLNVVKSAKVSLGIFKLYIQVKDNNVFLIYKNEGTKKVDNSLMEKISNFTTMMADVAHGVFEMAGDIDPSKLNEPLKKWTNIVNSAKAIEESKDDSNAFDIIKQKAMKIINFSSIVSNDDIENIPHRLEDLTKVMDEKSEQIANIKKALQNEIEIRKKFAYPDTKSITCTVCLKGSNEDSPLLLLACGHHFHQNCLDE